MARLVNLLIAVAAAAIIAVTLARAQTIPTASAPATARASRSSGEEINLPIGSANFGDLRLGSYPKDTAKDGLYAIGMYAHTRLPPLPALYDRAAQRQVARGPVELIGRFSDQYTPLKIMRYSIKDHVITIEVGLSPKAPTESNYLWGELPKDLNPGTYYVKLTAYEVEEKEGRLVPAQKSDIRAFEVQECFFALPQDPALEKIWEAQDKAVEQSVDALYEKLKFLEREFPKARADYNLALESAMTRTASGDLALDNLHVDYNWDTSQQRKHPIPDAAGIFFQVSVFRYPDPYWPKDVPTLRGPVVWDGKAEARNYALDDNEVGWKFRVMVEGNRPDFGKRVNDAIDESLTTLAKSLAAPRDAATR